MGNNAGITVAGAWGQFELNVFKPMLIASLLQSTRWVLFRRVSISKHVCDMPLNTVELQQQCFVRAT